MGIAAQDGERDMYGTYEITSSAHSSDELLDWFRSRGHKVTMQGPESIVVCMDELKLGFIMRSPELAGASAAFVKPFSEPVGLIPGEWVVMRSVGVAGRVAWEVGNSNTPHTAANVTVGSATWYAGRADQLIRVSELDAELAERIMAIGEQQAEQWEGLMENIPLRQSLFDILPVEATA
jgi:hypothetical protein